MAKALVITEKPSVARDISQVFSGFEEHDGYFENDDYVVTFAVGHLFELLPPEEVDEKYKAWTLAALPILVDEFRYKPKSGQSERIRTIKKLMARKDVDDVVNALPDFHCEILEMTEEAERVVARMRFSGTHTDRLLGVPGSGRRVAWDGSAHFRFSEGLVEDLWVLGDVYGLLRQLDAETAG